MEKLLKLNIKITFLIFVVIDLLCVGIGMGVPFFCIMFGFVVGWYITKRATMLTVSLKEVFRKVLAQALITSLFTFAVMGVIWGPTIRMLFDPAADFKNFGIPLILYDPKISFVGWLVLMIFVSPFLQLLTTIFTSYLTLLNWFKKDLRK